MSEIPRYRMTNNYGHQDNENSSWIKYEDHVEQVERSLAKGYEAGFLNGEKYASTGKLHIPPLMLEPTPAELIPTLVEHEWVRGTTGEGEFMGTVFPSRPYPEGRGVSAGRQTLRHSHGGISRSILTIERCDAPVVK